MIEIVAMDKSGGGGGRTAKRIARGKGSNFTSNAEEGLNTVNDCFKGSMNCSSMLSPQGCLIT